MDGTVAGGSDIFVVVVVVVVVFVVVASVDVADDHDDDDDGGDDVDNALMRVTSKRELVVSRGFASILPVIVLAGQTRQEKDGDNFLSNSMV